MWLYNENHRLLIYDVKRTAKIDGMGPFKVTKEKVRGYIQGTFKEFKAVKTTFI